MKTRYKRLKRMFHDSLRTNRILRVRLASQAGAIDAMIAASREVAEQIGALVVATAEERAETGRRLDRLDARVGDLVAAISEADVNADDRPSPWECARCGRVVERQDPTCPKCAAEGAV